MLHVPRTQEPLELLVPLPRAIDLVTEQLNQGEIFLRVEYQPGVLDKIRRDVLRWQYDSQAVVDAILDTSNLASSTSPGDDPEMRDEEKRFMRLLDEVARDVAKLSGLLTRLRAAESPPPSPPPAARARGKTAPPPEPSSVVVPPPGETSSGEEGESSAAAAARSLVLLADPASASLPQYDADAVSTRDLIGNDEVVDAFAYLIAATALQPPLAVGLFGHWGTGKSFLMRSILRRIDDITRGARESGRRQADIGVYQRVVQIEFNAWHYVEGNLWASMVDHILSNLRTSSEEATTELDERRRKVTQSLASTQQEKRTLDARIDALNHQKDDAQHEAEQLRAEQEAKLKEIGRLRLKDVAAAAMLTDTDQKTLKDALTRVGVPGAADSAADAASSLADARQVVQRGNLLVAPMREYGWRWAALLVAVALIAPATAFVLERWNASGVTQVLTAVAGFLSAAALVVRKSTAWVGRTLDKIETAERQVRARVEEEAEHQADRMAAREHQIADLERQLGDALRRRDDVASTISTLEEERDNLTPGKLLASFLDERTASSDYRKHLGLTALVRRDFEELSRLVGAYNEDALKSDAPVAQDHSTPFNRIVLYIDDLDRCPPHRVVEVLQAVHLLLSFPVFVVLVAVDPRWLSQSLESEYRELLRTGADDVGQAAPQDYLEKIFQIPFSVAPLDLTGRVRFVTGLLGDETEPVDVLTPAVPGGVPALPGTDAIPVVPDRPQTAVDSQRAPAVVEPAEDGDGADDGRSRVDLSPGRLRFTSAELQFLQDLLPLLDTSPRSLKRYINIYRLIKVVARLSPNGETPTSGPHPYESAMLLLAIQSGLPTVGPGLVARVGRPAFVPPGARPPRLADVVEAFAADLHDGDRRAELANLRVWLEAHPATRDWPAPDLAPYARHVRLYSFV